MYVQREAETMVQKFLKRPEILALVGPRQSGKTTLMKIFHEKLPHSSFISFEDARILGLFEHEIDHFAEIYVHGRNYLFIDEFQYASHGGKLLKYLFDHFKIKIIISGSSVADLTIQAIKYLVGRVIVLELFPFNFFEFLSHRDTNYALLYKKYQYHLEKGLPRLRFASQQYDTFTQYFEEYALWGGYPQVVTTLDHEEKKVVLKNIYNTYFLRDVHELLALLDDYQFSKLLEALALQVGSLISYQELCQISGLSFETLKRYLSFLSKTYILDLIRPYFTNRRKEIAKNPKVYFCDTGLRNAVVDDFRPFSRRPDVGALLENAVFMQLQRQSMTLNYWRDKNQNEVDFILDFGEQKKAAIEVKYRFHSSGIISKAFEKMHPNIPAYPSFLQKNHNTKSAIFIPLL